MNTGPPIAVVERVNAFLRQIESSEARLSLVVSSHQAEDFGWVFFYKSADADGALAGNAPLIYERETHTIITTGTAEPLERYLDAYRCCGDPHARPGRNVRVTDWRHDASAVKAIKLIRTYTELGLRDAKIVVEAVLEGAERTVRTPSPETARELALALEEVGFSTKNEYVRPDSAASV